MADDVKRFKRVLHVREVEREITQSELAVRMREEEAIMDRLSGIEALRDDAMAEFCSEKGFVSPQQLWFERQSIDVMEKNIDEGKQELEHCRTEIEETKTVLLERHRNVQLLEHYVDKLKVREGKRIVGAEQSNLDDINTMRFQRGFNKEMGM
jgi:flagellar export protein FliJ